MGTDGQTTAIDFETTRRVVGSKLKTSDGAAEIGLKPFATGVNVTLRVKNWEKFQHYKNRKPPWIRLYNDLLDDPEFNELDGDLVKTLIKIWLAASEHDTDGTLPDIRTLALKIHVASNLLAKQLVQLNHWVEDTCEHDASNVLASETETETETESDQSRDKNTRSRATIKRSIPGDWKPNTHHKEIAIERGLNLDDQSERFRDWAISKATKYADWDRAFNNWLKNSRDGRRQSTNRAQQSVDASLRILREEL